MTHDAHTAPTALLPHLRASIERLHATARGLTDDDVRAPSLLPGWSRAHVLTHIARAADSRTRLLTAARTGADTPQYADEAQREREIEEGAGRPAPELAADLRGALDGFLKAAAEHPDTAWDVPVRWLDAGMRPVRRAVGSLVREVEVHHTDLDCGHGPSDWPPFFVARELATTAAGLRERADVPGMVLIADEDGARRPIGDGHGPRVSGPAAVLLGWLTGRTDGHGLTLSPPGPLPDVPTWRS
ncbi:maleylpyruvate isomerase family mycothiol-dependent enzyme [Streptomyces sp. NPDC048111]|uniref:maleylpyruvate isomerase family mycothiol-dependent enzyme n=1 Tax=Streptomyces sp. NPDC048111 TaxID=3365500 RepID=UPI0037241E97